MFMKEGMRMQYDIVTKHPEFLGQMMQGAMQANIDMLRNMTPEQRQQMMQNQIELMKSIPPEQLQEMMELMAPPQPK
jgi:hypothetical protein